MLVVPQISVMQFTCNKVWNFFDLYTFTLFFQHIMYSLFQRRLYSQTRFITTTTATSQTQTHPNTELDSALKYCIDLVRQDNDLISCRHSNVLPVTENMFH